MLINVKHVHTQLWLTVLLFIYLNVSPIVTCLWSLLKEIYIDKYLTITIKENMKFTTTLILNWNF